MELNQWRSLLVASESFLGKINSDIANGTNASAELKFILEQEEFDSSIDDDYDY